MKKICLIIVLVTVSLSTLFADDPFTVSAEEELGSGRFFLVNNENDSFEESVILDTHVDMAVSGMIARVSVTQNFKNSTDYWAEGIYMFPLPENAAVDSMKMIIGDRVIIGEIKEKEEAQAIYEEAKEAGQAASLLEQERPNMFTTNVANIAPGDSIQIEIQYQQEVRYNSGVFSMRFPMVVGPRYFPVGTKDAEIERLSQPIVYLDEGQMRNPVSINIALSPGFSCRTIESPYHNINTINKNNTTYSVNLADGMVPANRDFVLEWKPDRGAEPQSVAFSTEVDGEVFSTIMVIPPEPGTVRPLKREIIFVLDTSGSMSGESIVQAKDALLTALNRLKPVDHFNIVEFDTYTTKLFDKTVPATIANKRRAREYISDLEADNGTEMYDALVQALGLNSDLEKVCQVIFITDGNVGNEDELFRYIKQNLGDARMFTIGIGSAPNTYFMSNAARFGRGSYLYIGSISEVQEKMEDFFEKIESPLLTNINIDWGQAQVEAYPPNIPDLYAGEPLLFTVKSDRALEDISISGTLSDKPWEAQLQNIEFSENSGVDKLWASKKIAYIEDQALEGRDLDEIGTEVTEIALKHHLVTAYTSLVAVEYEISREEGEELQTTDIPANLPAGWDPVQSMAATGTGMYLYMFFGLLLLLAGAIVLFTLRLSQKK